MVSYGGMTCEKEITKSHQISRTRWLIFLNHYFLESDLQTELGHARGA
jgi:hypothetical protein